MISILELHRLFDLIVDNVGSPYFTSNQKDLFLQRGIQNYLNKFFNRQPDGHNAETSSNDDTDLSSLTDQVELFTNDQGELLYLDIDLALIDRKVYRYLMVEAQRTDGCDSFDKVRFVRHNDWISNQLNSFKRADTKYPTYRMFKGKLQLNPKLKRLVRLTVVLFPLLVTLDDPTDSGIPGPNAVDCELGIESMNEIVYLSLAMAGVNLREADFYQMVEREGTKNE